MRQIVVIGSLNGRELSRLLLDGLDEGVFLRSAERVIRESTTKCTYSAKSKGPRDKYGRVK